MIAIHRLDGWTLSLAILGMWGGLLACDGNPDVPEEPEAESVVITQWNDSTELFLEYPHLVAGEAMGNWAIHLSSMKDFKPIRSGTLTVRFHRPAGPAESFTIDAPARDGIFLLDPVIREPGDYRVELVLQSPQVSSQHTLPAVHVHGTSTEVPLAAEEAGGGIAFLKEQQWQIDFAVVPARQGTVRRSAAAPGEIVPPDGSLVEVSAPVDGIARAELNRNAPSIGQNVRAGTVLAVLSPTAQENGFAALRARIERLEREVARNERLLAAGAIPGKRLEESRHDLEVARAGAEALGIDGTGEDYRLRLLSPINGVIARRAFVPGGRVAAGDYLFTIVDDRTAWLRVRVPADVAGRIDRDAAATFTVDGSSDVTRTQRLVSVGSVLDPATRTVPVTYLVTEGVNRLTFGQLAQVSVPVLGTEQGVVIPQTAVIDDNGTPIAFVQAGGETFERRVLTLAGSDGFDVLVASGVAAGEMVVTAGAYQVRLASLAGNEFAGGHAH